MHVVSATPAYLASVDLSALPPPAVVAELDFEAIRAAHIADLQARWPGFDALLESDPAIKLLEVGAYRELLLRGAINDAARAVMLAFAGGTDLDQLAANHGVARLVLTPATDDAPAVLEGDADLRERAQLAAERLPWAGMTGGGYVAIARAAAPQVKHVAIVKRGEGRIDIVLLGRVDDGAVGPDTVATVRAAFEDEAAVQLTDVVTVRPATIIAYSPHLTLAIRRGPDQAIIRAAAERGVRAYAADRHRIGAIVYAQRLEAAASVGGVEHARCDIGDVDPGVAGAAFLAGLTIAVEILDA